MRRSNYLSTAVLLACAILFGISISNAQTAAPMSSDVSYTVAMSKPYTHLFEVEVRVKIPANLQVPNESDLVMPVWTPGSYLIREFERHVQEFAADVDGRALDWTKTDKNTWRVKTGGARQWRVTYRVYANELTVRTSELNSDHAFWNNATLLMYPGGYLNAPSTLRIVPLSGWKIATGLPEVKGQPNTFRAENFDVLYDSPVEVSNFRELDFQVGGVAHRIVIDGEGNYDPERMRRDVQKIVAAETAMFGGIPYHDYTFILHLRSNTGGGLEHLNSTALGFKRFGFATEDGYRRFQALVAHEFFHLWNVKRIRPDALGPFDYTKENYTRLLWVAEGITEYYGQLMVRRAGLISDQIYLDHLAKQIQDFQETPSRQVMSAEDASFDSWIKFYRPDENTVNSQISYYDKGELLGLLLDLDIRRRTNNRKSLDDVMRYLFTEFYQKGRNYTPADFQKACELMAGASLEEFFSRYVRGREDLMPVYNQMLAGVGLRLEQHGIGLGLGLEDDRQVRLKAFLGADLEDKSDGGFVVIKSVRAGSPAYEQGLNAKDKIIALDGARVDKDTFEALIAAKRPGDMVRIMVFRFDDVRTFDIRLAGRVDAPYRIIPIPQANEQQKRIYQAWLGK
ncbi:MAG TPA: PDZ domain-containing protein [Pyrinomonadaceae bacterium]|nr:PDZ domain-containing protein [Pyrinomonadaceae bacterium]